jgi:hypothetical protein
MKERLQRAFGWSPQYATALLRGTQRSFLGPLRPFWNGPPSILRDRAWQVLVTLPRDEQLFIMNYYAKVLWE